MRSPTCIDCRGSTSGDCGRKDRARAELSRRPAACNKCGHALGCVQCEAPKTVAGVPVELVREYVDCTAGKNPFYADRANAARAALAPYLSVPVAPAEPLPELEVMHGPWKPLPHRQPVAGELPPEPREDLYITDPIPSPSEPDAPVGPLEMHCACCGLSIPQDHACLTMNVHAGCEMLMARRLAGCATPASSPHVEAGSVPTGYEYQRLFDAMRCRHQMEGEWKEAKKAVDAFVARHAPRQPVTFASMDTSQKAVLASYLSVLWSRQNRVDIQQRAVDVESMLFTARAFGMDEAAARDGRAEVKEGEEK